MPKAPKIKRKKRIEFGQVRIGPTAHKHIRDCLRNHWASMGDKTKLFESEWGKLFNYRYNVMVSSGTDAVINACLALYDLGAKEGECIIVPALGFIATSNAVRAAGFTPLFADIKRETLNIDETLVESLLRQQDIKKVVAIIAVNTMGKPCKMDSLRELCDKYQVTLICDNAEGHGCKYQGKFMGEWADMVTYSFYAAHLVYCGEGGMVSTNREDLYNVLRSTRSHGRANADLYFNHVRRGFNSKPTDICASIGLEGIEKFGITFQTRYNNMMEINSFLKEYDDIWWISEQDADAVNCPHGISVTLKPRENASIETLKYYFDYYNVHWKRNFGCIPTQHGAFSTYKEQYEWLLPNAEYVGNNGIHIGCHAYLTPRDIVVIKKALLGYLFRQEKIGDGRTIRKINTDA